MSNCDLEIGDEAAGGVPDGAGGCVGPSGSFSDIVENAGEIFRRYEYKCKILI